MQICNAFLFLQAVSPAYYKGLLGNAENQDYRVGKKILLYEENSYAYRIGLFYAIYKSPKRPGL